MINRNVLTSMESVLRRYMEYFEEMKNEENERKRRLDDLEIVHQEVKGISKDEVRTAIRKIEGMKMFRRDASGIFNQVVEQQFGK